jgi:hypothetical protein
MVIHMSGLKSANNIYSSIIHSQRIECKGQGSTAVRKVQKADREKMRRDKLNEQFQELGNALGNAVFFASNIKGT